MSLAVPDAIDDITTDWLSEALGRPVASLRATRIGEDEGFMGGGVFRLETDAGQWVAKLSPSDPEMRRTMAAANAREVTFYSTLSGGLPVPSSPGGAVDPDTGASVVLLDDMSCCRSVAYHDGFGPREITAVLASQATIHARWWDRPEVASLSGVSVFDEFPVGDYWADYPAAVRALLPDIELPARFRAIGDYVAANMPQVFGVLLERGPLTVVHRDCQADNVMFDADGTAVLFDWQMMGKGRGTYDAAYALISSVPPGVRARIERDALGQYHARLLAGGVTNYGWNACWRDYRRSVIGKLSVTVVATVLLNNDSAHKRRWRRTDLQRLLAFCDDHDLGPADLAP